MHNLHRQGSVSIIYVRPRLSLPSAHIPSTRPPTGILAPAQPADLSGDADHPQGLSRVHCLGLCGLSLCSRECSGECAAILGLSSLCLLCVVCVLSVLCLLIILCLLIVLLLLIGLVLIGLALVSLRGSRIRIGAVLLVCSLLRTLLSGLSALGTPSVGRTVGGSASSSICCICCLVAALQRLQSIQKDHVSASSCDFIS